MLWLPRVTTIVGTSTHSTRQVRPTWSDLGSVFSVKTRSLMVPHKLVYSNELAKCLPHTQWRLSVNNPQNRGIEVEVVPFVWSFFSRLKQAIRKKKFFFLLKSYFLEHFLQPRNFSVLERPEEFLPWKVVFNQLRCYKSLNAVVKDCVPLEVPHKKPQTLKFTKNVENFGSLFELSLCWRKFH